MDRTNALNCSLLFSYSKCYDIHDNYENYFIPLKETKKIKKNTTNVGEEVTKGNMCHC